MDQGRDQAAQIDVCRSMLGRGVNEGKGRALTKRKKKETKREGRGVRGVEVRWALVDRTLFMNRLNDRACRWLP